MGTYTIATTPEEDSALELALAWWNAGNNNAIPDIPTFITAMAGIAAKAYNSQFPSSLSGDQLAGFVAGLEQLSTISSPLSGHAAAILAAIRSTPD